MLFLGRRLNYSDVTLHRKRQFHFNLQRRIFITSAFKALILQNSILISKRQPTRYQCKLLHWATNFKQDFHLFYFIHIFTLL